MLVSLARSCPRARALALALIPTPDSLGASPLASAGASIGVVPLALARVGAAAERGSSCIA